MASNEAMAIAENYTDAFSKCAELARDIDALRVKDLERELMYASSDIRRLRVEINALHAVQRKDGAE